MMGRSGQVDANVEAQGRPHAKDAKTPRHAKASAWQTVCHPTNGVTEVRVSEVDQQAESHPRELQVGQELHPVNRVNCSYGARDVQATHYEACSLVNQ